MFTVELPLDGLTRARLPAICPLSGATEGLKYKPVDFSWYPAWVNLLLLPGLVFAIIAMSILTRRAAGEMPFGPRAWLRWKVGQAVFVLSIAGALVGLIFGAVVLSDNAAAVGAGVLLASVAMPVGVWWKLVRNHGIAVVEITESTVVLRIPNERAARAMRGEKVGPTPLAAADEQRLSRAAAETRLSPDGARCAQHPDTQAPWCCGRCGSFFCPRCAVFPFKTGNPVCATCFGPKAKTG